MISTDAGIEIDLSDEHCPNAQLSIRVRREFGAKVTVSREEQKRKQSKEMISKEAGIEIDLSDEQEENAQVSIRARREIGLNMTVTREEQK
jgi:hypothetical protein